MKETKKMTLEELKSYSMKKAAELFAESEAKSVGDPVDVDMNSMVPDGKQKPEAKVTVDSTKSAEVSSDDPVHVNMNSMDKEQGSDGKAATAVKAGASSASHGDGDEKAGLKKVNFESKTDQPSEESGTPFDEKKEAVMNEMDAEVDEGTKTYVEAGGDMGSSQSTNTGMKKPVVHEEAPEKKTDTPIADAIQIKEGKFSKKDLLEFVSKEAKKIVEKL